MCNFGENYKWVNVIVLNMSEFQQGTVATLHS